MLFGRLRDRLLRDEGVCFEAGEGEGGCTCLAKGWRCSRRRRWVRRGWEGGCWGWVRVGGLLLSLRLVSLLLFTISRRRGSRKQRREEEAEATRKV
jgi:hypothetical protein